MTQNQMEFYILTFEYSKKINEQLLEQIKNDNCIKLNKKLINIIGTFFKYLKPRVFLCIITHRLCKFLNLNGNINYRKTINLKYF